MQTTFCFSNIEILAVRMTEICTMLGVFYRRVPTNSAANNSVVGMMSILDVIHSCNNTTTTKLIMGLKGI